MGWRFASFAAGRFARLVLTFAFFLPLFAFIGSNVAEDLQ
jgi:hypothetical protein